MTAKEFLMQAYRLNELIDSDAKELERVQGTKDPEPPFVKYLGDIIDMERKIHSELCELVTLKKRISESLEHVSDREERLLLTYRYLNNYTWEEIGRRLNVSNRTVHRIHASALKNFIVPN